MTDVGNIHHAGFVVRDMAEALDVLKKLGFVVEPPLYGTLPSADGELKPFGAANAHIRFKRNFLEVVTIVGDDPVVPPDARLVPLEVPPEQLPVVAELIQSTVNRFAARLDRFQGMHRVVFGSRDLDATAVRLDEQEVSNSGINVTHLPATTDSDEDGQTVRHIELAKADDEAEQEGILAIAEVESSYTAESINHPNGAVGLSEVVLCVARDGLPTLLSRYERYLDRPGLSAGKWTRFDLGGTRLSVISEEDLDDVLPGEIAPALPAYLAAGISVQDLDHTEQFLVASGLKPVKLSTDRLLISSTQALGAAIVFHEGAV